MLQVSRRHGNGQCRSVQVSLQEHSIEYPFNLAPLGPLHAQGQVPGNTQRPSLPICQAYVCLMTRIPGQTTQPSSTRLALCPVTHD